MSRATGPETPEAPLLRSIPGHPPIKRQVGAGPGRGRRPGAQAPRLSQCCQARLWVTWLHQGTRPAQDLTPPPPPPIPAPGPPSLTAQSQGPHREGKGVPAALGGGSRDRGFLCLLLGGRRAGATITISGRPLAPGLGLLCPLWPRPQQGLEPTAHTALSLTLTDPKTRVHMI